MGQPRKGSDESAVRGVSPARLLDARCSQPPSPQGFQGHLRSPTALPTRPGFSGGAPRGLSVTHIISAAHLLSFGVGVVCALVERNDRASSFQKLRAPNPRT